MHTLSPLRIEVESLGTVLRRHRLQRHFTVPLMGLAMDMVWDDYALLEADSEIPSMQTLFRICDLTGLSIIQVLRHVKQTVRQLLRAAISDDQGQRHPLQARIWIDDGRGTSPHVYKKRLLTDEECQQKAVLSPHLQSVWVQGRSACIVLEGDDDYVD